MNRRKRNIIYAVVGTLVFLSCCIVIPVVITQKFIDFDEGESASIRQMLLQYFNLNDGIHIVWAHAVNSQHDLALALNDTKIMMLEADIVLDPVLNIPIMSHPPSYKSDINLSMWLQQVLIASKKGIKLDFKQTDVLDPSMKILEEMLKHQPIEQPIILNADILRGPNNNITEPVDFDSFLNSVTHLENVIISPGWTTGYVDNTSSGYTWDDVRQMNDLVTDGKYEVTFPIRASLVSKSVLQLIWLLEQNPNRFTLTIWTSLKDKYNIDDLLVLRRYKRNVYFDLPEFEVNKLKHS